MKSGRLVALLTALPGLFGLGVAHGADPGVKETSETPGKADNVAAQPAGGFSFELPVWKPAHHGAPAGLVASYSWNGKPARTATAERAKNDKSKDVWRLDFPDQPKPDEIARLELTYSFSLSDHDKAAIREAAEKVVDDVLQAVREAGGTPNFDQQLSTNIAAALASDAAKLLSSYANAKGDKRGLDVVAERMGLARRGALGWSVKDRESLVALANQVVIGRNRAAMFARSRKQIEAVKPPPGDKPCTPIADPAAVDVKAANEIIKQCLPTLVEEAEAKAAEPAIRNDKAKAAEVKDALAVLKRPTIAPDDWPATLTTLRKHGLDSYTVWAMRLAAAVIGHDAADGAWKPARDSLVSDISTAIENTVRNEVGSTLIEGAHRPRRYDVSTGVVYAAGIEDMMIPTLISICAWEGCLTPDSAAWTATHGWGRAFSLDAGIRLKTIDSQDPRQSEKTSFLVGLSFNPVTILRLSAGAYFFENAQTRNWNATPYAGVTVNVLNAAELLGKLGLGDFKPEVGSVNQ